MWRSGFQFEIERLFSGIEGGGGGALAVIRLIAKMVLIRSRSLTTFTELTTYLPLFNIGEVLL